MRRDVSGMDGLVGLWGCDEGQGSALTDWTDNHACCLGRGGTEWIEVPRGVPVMPIRGHGRWELLAAVGLRPDFEADDHRLPEEAAEGDCDTDKAESEEKVSSWRAIVGWTGYILHVSWAPPFVSGGCGRGIRSTFVRGTAPGIPRRSRGQVDWGVMMAVVGLW